MKRALTAIALALLVAGCGTLLPKKVELFQDKVKAFPEPSAKQVELQKQVAERAHTRAGDTVRSAILEQVSTNVLAPAKEVELLTGATVLSVGPPMSQATISSDKLVRKLEEQIARLEGRMVDFKEANNENAGKKIEGTGLIQVPYVLWTGGILLVLFVLFSLLKLFLSVAALSNPAAALGLGALKVTQGVVTKGFAQVVHGGEQFKEWVSKEVQDSGLREKILEAFQSHQMKAQDRDVQDTVKALTR